MSEDEFRSIFRAEYIYVCRTFCRLGVRPGEVEDLAQELFVLVHRHLHSFDRTRSVRAWLYGFVVRLAANYRRLRRHTMVEGDCDLDGLRVASPSHARDAETRDLVLRALARLDDEKRLVLVLFDLEGFGAQEIADMTGVPLNTVYSRVRLAREAFRAAVQAASSGRMQSARIAREEVG